jgi:uncharacterized LabA/DUF88 family protein
VGKNVAVFVDVANIFYAAKAAGTDIDYVTLLKAATAGRDFVRAYAYTGLDPENENQRNFHAFLARNHYKVVSKDIRKYGDGKVKANLDIELVVDMMKTARNLDVAIVVSGDGDFAPAIRAVQEMGVRVEVISFRGNTSSDLIEVADLFTDITQLAKVDKSSSRSGRRVAGDEEDLSMTEVPDKQTEGTGQRGRGRGRGRSRSGEAEPVAASGARRSSTRSRSGSSAAASAASAGEAVVAGNGSMTILPGEKLSRVAAKPAPSAAEGSDDEELTPFDIEPGEGAEVEATDESDAGAGEGRRRRRRRGGRGRGRGRGRDGEGVTSEAGTTSAEGAFEDDEDEEDIVPAPRGPRTTPFGSVWDSQLGTPTARGPVAPLGDDEDFDEPEIPEYLIAEQRRGRSGQGAGQGGRGGRGGGGRRGAYNAAIERERYGRGGGGGINRYPDVSGRGGQGSRGGRGEGGYSRSDSGRGGDRYDRPAPRSGGDPWSEVPPELEEMLRAQLAQSPKARRPEPARPSSRIEAADASGELETMTLEDVETPTEAAPEAPAAARKRAPARRRTPAPAEAGAGAATGPSTDATAEAAPPKRRTTRKKADADPVAEAATVTADGSDATAAAKPRATRARKSAATAGDAGAGAGATDESAAPKRRTTRKKAEPA